MSNRAKVVRRGPIRLETSVSTSKSGRVQLKDKEIHPAKPTTSPKKPTTSPKKSRETLIPAVFSPLEATTSPFNGDENLPDYEPQDTYLFDVWVDEDDADGDRNHKSQHDFVREWIPKAKGHLRTILARDNLVNGGRCISCSSADGLWKCEDCQGTPAFCRECCRASHARLPYHRIRFWTGRYYKRDWLFNLGVYIHLGHNGSACGSPPNIETQILKDDPGFTEKKVDIYASPSGRQDQPVGAKLFTVGHPNGIHKVWVLYCGCSDSAENDHQLLNAGLFPLSFHDARSAFTFELLDDFRKTNLSCKVSTYYYYKKLRRLTHPWFYKYVPDRYRELRRIAKQWRYLKHIMHSGQYLIATCGLSPGSLALFCAACPQEGVNVPKDWWKDSNQLPYTRIFVMDGNFSAVHQKQREYSTDPWLTDGSLFLAPRADFDTYLADAVEEKEKPTCNRYHAVNDRLIEQKGRDVTGIGATACARHGAFAPGAVVNFQKGERQVNMDYSLCSAVANTNVGDLPNIIALYDIGCQYRVNFEKRVTQNDGIEFPFDKNLTWGIGEFHVTAHVPHCFPRYSPQFIRGAARVDGEILETLWSLLRDVFPSTQTSTLASRADMLNEHMQENNLKKVLGIEDTIAKKYETISKLYKKSEKSFEKLTRRAKATDKKLVLKWEQMAIRADLERLESPAAMDIYDTTYEFKVSRAERQNQEFQEERKTGAYRGATAWIVEGMKIQEMQHSVRVLCKRSIQTKSLQRDIFQKRQTLQERLIKFHEDADTFLRGGQTDTEIPLPTGTRNDWIADDYIDSDEEPVFIPDTRKRRLAPVLDSPRKKRKPAKLTDPTLPENQDVLLPSTLGMNACRKLNILPLASKEMNLREGQANDALSAIRHSIGEKSFLLRKKIRPVVSKKQKGRGWTAIHAGNRRMRHNQWLYGKARESMVALDASEETLSEFRKLKGKHLKTITTVVVPNAPGQRGKKLSWIWTVGLGRYGKMVLKSSEMITEMARVNWLRARADYKRCKEEIELVRREMVWVTRFFIKKHEDWHMVAEDSEPTLRPFAEARSAMWHEMARHAQSRFQTIYPDLSKTFGYISVTTP